MWHIVLWKSLEPHLISYILLPGSNRIVFFEMFLSLSSRILQHISLCIDQSLSLKLFSKECIFFKIQLIQIWQSWLKFNSWNGWSQVTVKTTVPLPCIPSHKVMLSTAPSSVRSSLCAVLTVILPCILRQPRQSEKHPTSTDPLTLVYLELKR